MPIYTVHVYREMRIKFTGIEAESPEEAARAGADLRTDQADDVEDCAGSNLSAVVDLEGDEDFERSADVAFHAGRMVDTGAEMLDALEQALAALNWAPRFRIPGLGKLDSYRIASRCTRVIAEAKGKPLPTLSDHS